MLKQGQTIEAAIIDVNHMGKGVARIDDFVVFINDVITEDVVQIEITEVKKNYALGKPIKIIKESGYRIEPPCEYYYKCGGCQLMHMDYREQLAYKKSRVLNELKRASVNMDEAIIYDTIGMGDPLRYRNKTAFSAARKNGETIIGPYEQGTYNTVNIEGCLLQSIEADRAVKLFKEIMIKNNIEAYDKKTGRGTIKNLVVRSNKKGELMLIIVTAFESLPFKNEIIKLLTESIREIKTIVQNVNPQNTNLVMGRKNITIYGAGTIEDTIGDLKFTISPDTFFQINSVQTEKLYGKAMEFADLSESDICFDLYCGIGTISLMAARYAKKVYGVEIVEQSIINARTNAKINDIHNTEFYTGETEKILPLLYKKNIRADVIILDPPRKGCEKEVTDTIIKMNPQKIVYVSCNPQTLARDVKLLEEGGYSLKKVQPLDMFPWGVHVETVVSLSHKNS